MAVAELRYGHNEQLKRIAQEIIIDQQQEIAAMKLAIGSRYRLRRQPRRRAATTIALWSTDMIRTILRSPPC